MDKDVFAKKTLNRKEILDLDLDLEDLNQLDSFELSKSDYRTGAI